MELRSKSATFFVLSLLLSHVLNYRSSAVVHSWTWITLPIRTKSAIRRSSLRLRNEARVLQSSKSFHSIHFRKFTKSSNRCRFLAARDDHEQKEDYDYDNDDDDDDDDEPPEVDVSQFRAPTTSFGLHTGRSSPSQRKGMGLSRTSTAKVFLCTHCGSEFVKWMGRCPTCKEWNTLQEHVVTRQETNQGQRPIFSTGGSSTNRPASWLGGDYGNSAPQSLADIFRTNPNTNDQPNRSRQRIVIPDDDEFNNVLGGGLLPGSLILVGGSPGVGKSTLLLQTAASLGQLVTPRRGIGMGQSKPENDSQAGLVGPVWYVSGEETPDQIATRAQRLGFWNEDRPCELYLWQETHADTICQKVVEAQQQSKVSWQNNNNNNNSNKNNSDAQDTTQAASAAVPPSLLIIDSIQTMMCDAAGNTASAGGITQVRECVGLFLRLAKSTNLPIILVGHVTKTGNVAGPRTVEHMVDCVLYLEGSDHGGLNQLRILRANKNRFGSADEVGVYEMTAGRLQPVTDPSRLLMEGRMVADDVEGCAISVALEGRRAVTVEVQGLVTIASDNKYARKTVDGIPMSRLLLLLGVLQKRCGLFFAKQDVYLNVAGQMKLSHQGRSEGNAADLAVTVALVSSLVQIPVRADTAFCGEVGLLGELRPVVSLEKRVQEARRMGFSRIVTAYDRYGGGGVGVGGGGKHYKNQPSSWTNQKLGIEWIQCQTLKDALNHALVSPLPAQKKQRSIRKTKETSERSFVPGSVADLGLEEVFDDEDEDEEYGEIDGFL